MIYVFIFIPFSPFVFSPAIFAIHTDTIPAYKKRASRFSYFTRWLFWVPFSINANVSLGTETV
jgi:hypothetical protein